MRSAPPPPPSPSHPPFFTPLLPQVDPSTQALLPEDDDRPLASHVKALGLRSWVRVLQTVMVGLRRGQQAVLLPRGRVIHYDVLVLASGIQDGALARLATIAREVRARPKGGPVALAYESNGAFPYIVVVVV
jgi:hypothetical protein